MAAKSSNRGSNAEELLRRYFVSTGYFVVRGVQLRYADQAATDLDLWLYHRASSLARHRINVDIKNRAIPKATERIIWAKGIQVILGLDNCIVATTGRSRPVKDFAATHGVQVLDGAFLGRLEDGSIELLPRLTEAEFRTHSFEAKAEIKPWLTRLEDARTRLLFELDFNGCNSWLEDAVFFLRAVLERRHPALALRLAYSCLSLFLIGFDFTTRQIALEDRVTRTGLIDDGLRYGERGRAHLEEVVHTAERLVSQVAQHFTSEGQIRREVFASIEALPINILSEYLSRSDVLRDLFKLARDFDHAAYSIDPSLPGLLPLDCQSILGCVLDFAGIERQLIYRAVITA